MSDTFITVANIPMDRAGFDAWLDAAIPKVENITNYEAMYSGWFWDPKEPPAPPAVSEKTVQAWLNWASSPQPFPMVCVHDTQTQALQLWVANLGYPPEIAVASFLVAAAAGPFMSESVAHAVFFAETSAQMNASNILSVLEVGKTKSRFVSKAPTDELIKAQEPICDLFFDADEGATALDERILR